MAIEWFRKVSTPPELQPINGSLTRFEFEKAVAVQDPPQISKKPTFEKIERSNLDPEYVIFASDCAKLLGYQTLQAVVVKPLAGILNKLEIEILNSQEVEDYKQAAVTTASRLWEKDNSELMKSPYVFMYRPKFSWQMCALNQSEASEYIPAYHEEVPEFALNKAIQIKREVPEAKFFVHRLTSFRDPFLSVSLGSESYFVEVWDEPKFEGRLTKDLTSDT
jgi:hypothetical protein